MVRVLFFAMSRELAGCNEAFTDLPDRLSGRQLMEHLCKLYPRLETVKDSLILAHNQEYIELADNSIIFKDNDEIAVIPPLSGG